MRDESVPSNPSPAAQRFLAAFRDASAHGDPVNVIVSDVVGFDAAITTSQNELALAFDDDIKRGQTGPAFINQSAFASAACDSEGRLVLADAAFGRWVMPAEKLQAALAHFDPKRPSISFLVEDRGKFIAVAAAPLAYSRNWPLAPEIKALLEAGGAKIAIIARLDTSSSLGASAQKVSRALGFTNFETRVSEGLVKAGNARGAAAIAHVSYETARDALKSAMKKAGVGSQSELVSLLVQLNSGEMQNPNTEGVLKDVFGLTQRQARVALLAANGLTRSEMGIAAAISEHAVKIDLASLFVAFNVDTIAGLSRAIAQVSALAALASATAIEFAGTDQQPEPLRLLPRAKRKGRIAFADHGPATGMPCLIIHSPTTSRHLPPSHVSELQALGLRPIGFDRPGTGMTDMVDGALIDQTAQDLVEILDSLSIDKTCIIARGGSILMAHFARHYPDRFSRGVSLNPDPRPNQSKDFVGMVGDIERAVLGRPKIISALVAQFSQRSTSKTVEVLVERALKTSAADRETLKVPGFLKAYVRATQQAALQNGAGFIAIHFADRSEPDIPLQDGSAMTILVGTQDPLCRFENGGQGWQDMWPGCAVHYVPDAGRLLQYQRPDLIATALLAPSHRGQT